MSNQLKAMLLLIGCVTTTLLGGESKGAGSGYYPAQLPYSALPAEGRYSIEATALGYCSSKCVVLLHGANRLRVNDPKRLINALLPGKGVVSVSFREVKVVSWEVGDYSGAWSAPTKALNYKPLTLGNAGYYQRALVIGNFGGGSVLDTERGQLRVTDLLAVGSQWSALSVTSEGKADRKTLEQGATSYCLEDVKVVRGALTVGGSPLPTRVNGSYDLVECKRGPL